MTADSQTFGFPPGYFVIRSIATDRLWDIKNDDVEDSTEYVWGFGSLNFKANPVQCSRIILWPEKEKSLVEGTWSQSIDLLDFF